MDILDQELGRWPSWTFRQPKVEVLLLALLPEHTIVAGAFVCDVINHLDSFLPLHFRLTLRVRDQVTEIVNEVAHATTKSSGAHNQRPLSVFPLF